MRALPSSRGFTLIELMVTIAVVALVMLGVVGVVGAQQKAYVQGQRQRTAQATARAALSYLEEKASIAGLGMDAPLALDLDRYAGPCPSIMSPCTRDRIDGPDELVFHARNPRYWTPESYAAEPAGNAWRIQSIGEGDVTVRARQGQQFVVGQVLQAVCRGGQRYAYMTVSASTTPVAEADGKVVTVPLLSSVPNNPFRRQDSATAGCFTGGEARLFVVDRYRFHVQPFAAGGSRHDPYLMLDTGVDVNGDGQLDAADELVVAEGIENIQVGYVLFDAAMPVRGTAPGTLVSFTSAAAGSTSGTGITTLSFPGIVPSDQSAYQPTSWYDYTVGPPGALQRHTDHQANIVALRITLSARAPTPAASTGAGGGPATNLYNMTSLPTWLEPAAPYERFVVEATIPMRNMLARGMNDF
jgi:type IV pilus assembly protein PilW